MALSKKFSEAGALQKWSPLLMVKKMAFEEYYTNGKIKWKGSYRNGDHEYGLLEKYDSTGVLVKKMECDSLFICRTVWKKEGYEDKE